MYNRTPGLVIQQLNAIMKLPQLKIIIYILLGVLPASFWVLFAPIVILKSVTFADMLGGIGMILGTVGIYLATFIRKPKSSTTIILTILLLFIGQAIMVVVLQDPFILRKFPNSKFDYMMALGTLGPILIAVHYQCYAIRQLTFNNKLFLVALFPLSALSIWFHPFQPNQDVVYLEAFDVDNVTLEHFPEREWKGIYSWEYARCTGFKKVNYQNYDHYYMGSGATLSIPESESKPRFKVTERLIDADSENWPEKVILEVSDTTKEQILGKREVWKNKSRLLGFEGTRGWKGEIAARFVRKILNPKQKKWSSTCTLTYPRTKFEVSNSEVEFTIDKKRLFSKSTNCDGISIDLYDSYQRQFGIRVIAPRWMYKTKQDPDLIYCIGDDIFVFSGISSRKKLYVDWLGTSGILKGQYKVTNYHGELATMDRKQKYIDAVEITDNILEITQIQIGHKIEADNKYSGSAVKSIFKINVTDSQGRNDWCENEGEKYTYFGKERPCHNVSPPNPKAQP